MIAGGASKIAEENGLQMATQEELITKDAQRRFEEFQLFTSTIDGSYNVRKDHDTVGAAALDRFGNLAAATSTGGITGKVPGRVGDSPLTGACIRRRAYARTVLFKGVYNLFSF